MKFLEFNFLKYRKYYILTSVFLVLFSLYFLFFWKLNLWIDMTWWINLDYSYTNQVSIEKIRQDFEEEKKFNL